MLRRRLVSLAPLFSIILTYFRKVKNATGVDINVPSYQKPAQGKNIKDYHVVVISDLPHFKKPEHSEEDVVQFMVSY